MGTSKSPAPTAAPFVLAEINAYIAIRDGLLAEAEQTHNPAKIESTKVANDFVAGCLKTARSPYHDQALPEADAARERARCENVRSRVAELQAAIA